MEMSFSILSHTIIGTIATIFGALGLFTKKGSKLHRKAGNWFFYTMFAMAFQGAILAFVIDQTITAMAGIFCCYLIASSWMTVKTPPGKLTKFDYVSPIFAAMVMLVCGWLMLQAMNAPDGKAAGFGAPEYGFFAIAALLSLSFDIKLLVQKGINGGQRLARHLWRMCFAFYIALGSAIFRSAHLFPEAIRESGYLELPTLLIVIVMLFYLGKLAFQGIKRKRLMAAKQAA